MKTYFQLYKIFQLLGTPTETEWHGYTSLPDYQTCFPKWSKRNLHQVIGSEHPIEAIRLLELVSNNTNFILILLEDDLYLINGFRC